MASATIRFLPLLLFLLISGVFASDSDVLLRLFSDLRLSGGPSSDPCRFPGISCEAHGIATRISLQSLGLAGFLSPSVGRLSSLRELSLANNLLSGALPNEIPACRELEILNLRGNSFSGEIPREISALVNLRVLDLSSNQFVGDLGFITYFPNLENLSLSHNLFSGEIPRSLSFHRNLLFVDLSGNSALRNSLPENSLRRDILLPKRYVFAEKIARNNKSATAVGAAPSPSPAASPGSNHDDYGKKVRNWLIGFLVGALVGIISGLFLSLLFRLLMNCIRGRYRNPGGPAIFSPLIKRAEDLAFLERDEEMASLEVIGRGGCGEVYRAQLPSGANGGAPGKTIAIKKIKRLSLEDGGGGLESRQEEESKLLDKWMRQIRAEIQTVGHIRHRNLLPLLAHVARPDCNYLIYEFMKNGSLQDALKDRTLELDWPARLKIGSGIAAGLEYLHMQHSPRIIHRDLKPANILLDDNLEARIADFGLAKAVPDANTHVTTSNVAGTVGYIAPEYHQTLKFTDKCDIYSFGVILGVLVIGMLPSDEFFQSTDEMSLVRWLRNVMKSENPRRAIDPRLAGRDEWEGQMVLVLRIACFCTADDPKERPNSKDVRCMLSQIV